MTAPATTYPALTVTAGDTGNAAVPTGNATSTATSLLVNPQVTLATNLGPSWPDAVQGRAYGQGTGCTGGNCTAMIYTAAGGLGTVGGYTFPVTSAFPAALTCTPASPNLSCSTAGISQTPGTYHPSVTAVDVANAATPAATTTSDPASTRGSTDTLIVDAPLAATLTQNTPGLTTNPATLIPGVVNRSYGIINAAARRLPIPPREGSVPIVLSCMNGA